MLYSAIVYLYIDLASSAWITPLAAQGAFIILALHNYACDFTHPAIPCLIFSMGAKVKDQCTPVRRGAWGQGYFSPQNSIFITLGPQEVKSNAVYCTQHTCVILLYIHV